MLNEIQFLCGRILNNEFHLYEYRSGAASGGSFEG